MKSRAPSPAYTAATYTRQTGVVLLALTLSALPALAHHPLGGATPTTFWHGFLSGIGHPVIGFDHLAFIVAVGIASAFTSWRYLAPAIFVAATVIGCLVHLGGFEIAGQETLIAASVALIGVLLLSGRDLSTGLVATLFTVAGLLHGGAYAGAIIGAETTPVVAYLTGFAAIQYAIAAALVWVTHSVWQASRTGALQPRLAGAVIAGIGLTFLVEYAEAAMFGAM